MFNYISAIRYFSICFYMVSLITVSCTNDELGNTNVYKMPYFSYFLISSNNSITSSNIKGACVIIIYNDNLSSINEFLDIIREFEFITEQSINNKLCICKRGCELNISDFALISDDNIYELFIDKFKNQTFLIFDGENLIFSKSTIERCKISFINALAEASGYSSRECVSPFVENLKSYFAVIDSECKSFLEKIDSNNDKYIFILDFLGYIHDSKNSVLLLIDRFNKRFNKNAAIVCLSDRYLKDDILQLNMNLHLSFKIYHISYLGKIFNNQYLKVKQKNFYRPTSIMLAYNSLVKLKYMKIYCSIEELETIL